MSVDTVTGQNTLLAKLDISSVVKMAAGAHSFLLLTFGDNGKLLLTYHTDTGVIEQVPLEKPLMFAYAEEDTYWIDLQDVCSLYRNGEMVFGMPDGLFTAYYQYVMGSGALSADEVVKELNRVVNMYYGE